MSIFVLNLATLLGLGLGRGLLPVDDEPIPRGAGAPTAGPDARRPMRSGSTVATAGRAVFFSGLTVLLGLLGLVLFEFMILRSVGIAGAIVVGLAVASALTLLPAVLTILGRAGGPVRRSARSRPAADADGPWSRLARRVMRHPVAVLVPTLSLPAGAGLAVPARPVQRAGRLDPAARGPVARRVRPAARRLRRRRVRADRPRHPDDRRCHRPGEPRRAVRLLAAAGRGPAGHPRRRASWTLDPRLTLDQYRLLYGDPNGPRDRYVAERPWRPRPAAT